MPLEPCDRLGVDSYAQVLSRLPGGAGSIYVVDRRYLRGQFRPSTLAAPGTLQDLAGERRQWTGGSDYDVTPYVARDGIWASLERETLKGVYFAHPFGTAEAIDVHTALRSYLAWAARQLFLEDRIGSLEPGKDADIAVWDHDLYTMPAADIKNLKCELTMLAGRVVYQDAAVPIPIRR